MAVIVDKGRQQVNLYRFSGRWRLVSRWACSTGKVRGRKEAEGDKKTPEGVYFVTRDVSGRFLTETYGSRALPLDYPNWLDRRRHRTGSSIWIHGTNKTLRDYDSNGCVVMANRDITELAGHVRPGQTPVVIVEHLELTSRSELRKESRAVLDMLKQWGGVLHQGSYEAFKAFYAPGAQPTMAWWRRWCRQRQRLPVGASHRSLIRRRAVIRERGGYVALFDHYLANDNHQVRVGRCRLYFDLNHGEITILGGRFQVEADAGDPLMKAWKSLWAIDQREKHMAAGRTQSSET
jgi:hypothetical protein